MPRMDASWIAQTAQAYFAACDATREETQRKDGSVSVRQVPYTMAGLAAALGLDRAALTQALGAGRGWGKAARQALRIAAARVEQHTVERALMGELNAAAAGVLLKDWGYGTEAAREEGGGLVITLEDKEGFGR